MKGHVRKRGKSSWAVVIDIGYDERGRRRQKWHSVKGTKRDAERELARLLNEVHTGRYVEPANMTVADYLDHWLDAYARLAVSNKTRERYKDMVDAHIAPAIGRHKLSQLRPIHVQAFYTDALVSGRKDGKGGLSAQTVLHFHRLLNKAFGQALRWQLVSINVVQAVEPPRPRRKEIRPRHSGKCSTYSTRLDLPRSDLLS